MMTLFVQATTACGAAIESASLKRVLAIVNSLSGLIGMATCPFGPPSPDVMMSGRSQVRRRRFAVCTSVTIQSMRISVSRTFPFCASLVLTIIADSSGISGLACLKASSAASGIPSLRMRRQISYVLASGLEKSRFIRSLNLAISVGLRMPSHRRNRANSYFSLSVRGSARSSLSRTLAAEVSTS